MKLSLRLMEDLSAAMDVIGRGTSSPAWLNAAASVLESCAREIRELTAAAKAAPADAESDRSVRSAGSD